MIDRIFGRHEKAGTVYKPKYENLKREVASLLEITDFYGAETYRKLITMTDMSSILGFNVVKSSAKEEGVAIVINNDNQKPVLEILLGAGGESLIGIRRTPEELFFWKIPYKEIGSDQNLGKAVRKIVFNEVKPEIYSLKKSETIANLASKEERPALNFTRRPQK